MFQARGAARVAEILQLQRVTADGTWAGATEPARCDGSLACDKPCDEQSLSSVFDQRFSFGNGGPTHSGVYMTAKE